MAALGFSELALVVANVRAAADFYATVVGLTPETEATDGWAWFTVGDGMQRLALRRGPLLFEEKSPLPEGARWGAVHFALRVGRADIEAMIAHVRACGVEVFGPVRIDWMRAESIYFYDLDGNLVEFWSPDPA